MSCNLSVFKEAIFSHNSTFPPKEGLRVAVNSRKVIRVDQNESNYGTSIYMEGSSVPINVMEGFDVVVDKLRG